MARRGFGGTALRAALGAVTGVAEGLQQRDILAAQKKREKDLMARQQAMDLAGLLSQGFEPVADVQRKQQAATGAAGSLIASALNAASMPFAGSAAGLPSAESQKLLSQGYAAAKPERTIDYGGQQLALRETAPERQERFSRIESALERQKKDDERRRADQEKAAATAARKTAYGKIPAIGGIKLDEEALAGMTPNEVVTLMNILSSQAESKAPKAGTPLSAAQQYDIAKEREAAEAWWNAGEPNAQARADKEAMFRRMRAANPGLNPRDIFVSMKRSWDEDRYKKGAGADRIPPVAPPGRTPTSPPPGPIAPKKDELDAAFEAFNKGK